MKPTLHPLDRKSPKWSADIFGRGQTCDCTHSKRFSSLRTRKQRSDPAKPVLLATAEGQRLNPHGRGRAGCRRAEHRSPAGQRRRTTRGAHYAVRTVKDTDVPRLMFCANSLLTRAERLQGERDTRVDVGTRHRSALVWAAETCAELTSWQGCIRHTWPPVSNSPTWWG